METTLVIIKPNGVAFGLVGRIVERYETARLCIRAIKTRLLDKKTVEGFYAEHVGKAFFPSLMDFMTSGPVILIALGGEDAIAKVRSINGATDPAKANAGTIRHDFAPTVTFNVVHASDSAESARREVAYWFQPHELVEYSPADHRAKV